MKENRTGVPKMDPSRPSTTDPSTNPKPRRNIGPTVLSQKTVQKSVLTKVLEWMISDQGKNVVRGTAGATGGVIFGMYLLPHTLLLDKTKEIVQMYRNGMPVAVGQEVTKRAEQVIKDLNLLERQKKCVSFFTVFGPDVYHKGSMELASGAIIGIPINYEFENSAQVDRRQLQLGQNPRFNWYSDLGEKLVDSLLLSPQGQKFAIAREMVHAKTHHIYANASVATGSFLAAYATGHSINHKLNLFVRPLKLRLAMYGTMAILGGMVYTTISDAINLYYDHHSDETVANLSKDYIVGGVEYYQKKIERNKGLRSALGELGPKLYTIHGNEVEWIRSRHLPLTSRLDYLKSRLTQVGPTKPGGSGGTTISGDTISLSPSTTNNVQMTESPPLAMKPVLHQILDTSLPASEKKKATPGLTGFHPKRRLGDSSYQHSSVEGKTLDPAHAETLSRGNPQEDATLVVDGGLRQNTWHFVDSLSGEPSNSWNWVPVVGSLMNSFFVKYIL